MLAELDVLITREKFIFSFCTLNLFTILYSSATIINVKERLLSCKDIFSHSVCVCSCSIGGNSVSLLHILLSVSPDLLAVGSRMRPEMDSLFISELVYVWTYF